MGRSITVRAVKAEDSDTPDCGPKDTHAPAKASALVPERPRRGEGPCLRRTGAGGKPERECGLGLLAVRILHCLFFVLFLLSPRVQVCLSALSRRCLRKHRLFVRVRLLAGGCCGQENEFF